MRIRRFSTEKLYGYLDLSATFNSDLTFLTGINGSGKTSVIRGISALLAPALQTLAQWNYLRLSLEVEHKGEAHIISAGKDSQTLTMTVSGIEEPLTIPVPPPEWSEHHRADSPAEEYFEAQFAKHADHPVLRCITDLPTPMILGIDRRSQEPIDQRVVRRQMVGRRARPTDIFRSTMAASLREAATLAEQKYREIELCRTERADRLRERIILSAFEYKYSPGLGTFELQSARTSLKVRTRLDVAAQTLTELVLCPT